MVGQEVSCRILTNSILMARVPKSCLIFGIHGVGKTTLARIYAKALNCERFAELREPCCECDSCVNIQKGSHIDVIEMDAASHNGVDDVRRLDQVLSQRKTGKYRVFIFDECHMFSKSAQAALLKTIEEPPANTVFMLVTTDPQKLEETLASRCLSMPLKALSPADISANLKMVLDKEGISYSDDFVETLGIYGGGSLRDAQQILDQMIIAAGGGELTLDTLQNRVGIISIQQYRELASALIMKDPKLFLKSIETWYREGIDLVYLFEVGIPNVLRDFMIHLSGSYSDSVHYLSGLTDESFSRNLSLSLDDIRKMSTEWGNTVDLIKYSLIPKTTFSMYAVNVCG